MVKEGDMLCEKCNSDMWDNRENKKNPKGPDFKCKNVACGHAVWLDKKALKKSDPAVTSTPPNGNAEELKLRSMVMAYAKDLVVAELNRDMMVGQPCKEVIAVYNELLIAIKTGV